MNVRDRAESSPKAAEAASGDVAAQATVADMLRFDDFEFDVRRSELRRTDGRVVPLRPKTESLLRRLLMEPGRLLTKDELIDSVWPASVVTDDSLVQCIGELRQALGDDRQRLIRTVPRRGYRLECAVTRVGDGRGPGPAEVRVVGAGTEQTVVPAAAPTALSRVEAPRSRASLWLVALIVALGTVLGVVAYQRFRPAPMHIDDVIAARATFAIMPFAVSDDDPSLRRLADAVTDGIATEFAPRLGMRALGRAATATLAAQGRTPAEVAATLKATGALTGRVAHSTASPTGAAVDVQLLFVSTGLVFWTKHYEFADATSAAGIEQIGRQVVNAVRGAVTTRAVERSEVTDASIDPADLTNRGWNDLDRRASIEDLQRGRRRFVRALRADADSVIARLGYASSFAMQLEEQRQPLTTDERVEYERVVERLLRAAPESATALRIWATMQMSRGRPELALSAIDKSIRLVPSFPNGYVLRAEALLMLGRTREVEAEVDRAISLAEFDTRHMSRGYAIGAEAAIMLGDDERARDLARHAVIQYPGNYRAQGALAAAEALTGHDAGAPLAALRQLWPQATVASYDAWASDRPDYVEQRARFYQGLRRAGLPER